MESYNAYGELDTDDDDRQEIAQPYTPSVDIHHMGSSNRNMPILARPIRAQNQEESEYSNENPYSEDEESVYVDAEIDFQKLGKSLLIHRSIIGGTRIWWRWEGFSLWYNKSTRSNHFFPSPR
jgi:hypothetical protein